MLLTVSLRMLINSVREDKSMFRLNVDDYKALHNILGCLIEIELDKF